MHPINAPYSYTLFIHPINSPYPYTTMLSTHPINAPYQHTLLTHPINTSSINTPYQHTSSTHPINTPYQQTLSTHSINTSYPRTISTHLINTPYQYMRRWDSGSLTVTAATMVGYDKEDDKEKILQVYLITQAARGVIYIVSRGGGMYSHPTSKQGRYHKVIRHRTRDGQDQPNQDQARQDRPVVTRLQDMT